MDMIPPFPASPTGTTGLQKTFAIAIRKVFRNNLRKIYSFLDKNKDRIQESVVLKCSIDDETMNLVNNVLDNMQFQLSPIVKKFVMASWWKANMDIASFFEAGKMIPFDDRISQAMENNTYVYLFDFINNKHSELKELLKTGISQGDSIKTISANIKDSFKITSWKSELIARSEVIRTYGQSTRTAISNAGVTKEYKWLTSKKENVCPICRPLHGRIFQVDNPKSPMPVTDTHPQCNCGIVPHVRI